MGGNASHPDDEMDCRAKGSSGSIPLKPLRFHDVCSSGIVSPNKLVMRRMDQGWGITFSNRPLDVDEIICLKIVMFHKGFLRFGLTSQDPAQLEPHSLEKFRFDSSKRTIIKELSASCTRKDTMIFLKMNAAGEIVYSWQRNEKTKDKGVLFGGITLDVPLWAVFEISGKNLAVKLEVDNIPLIRTKSFKKITHLKKSRSVEYLQSSRSIFNIDLANINESFSKLPSKRIKTPKSSDRFPRAKSFSISYPAVYVPMEVSDAVSPGPENHVENTANLFNIPLSNIDFQTEDLPAYCSNAEKVNNNPNNKLSSNEECKTSMCFHRSVGKNISLSSDQMTATRTVGNCNGYIFTRRPLEANEKLTIKLLQVNPEVGGSLGFGVTVCDPSQVSHFPDDADLLLDRQEYWVVIKNLYKNPVANDEIGFLLTKTGEVVMFKNNVCLKTIVHVDPTLSLWIFFDLCGSVEKISSQGSIIYKNVPKDLFESRKPPPRNLDRQQGRRSAVETSAASMAAATSTTTSTTAITPPNRMTRLDLSRPSQASMFNVQTAGPSARASSNILTLMSPTSPSTTSTNLLTSTTTASTASETSYNASRSKSLTAETANIAHQQILDSPLIGRMNIYNDIPGSLAPPLIPIPRASIRQRGSPKPSSSLKSSTTQVNSLNETLSSPGTHNIQSNPCVTSNTTLNTEEVEKLLHDISILGNKSETNKTKPNSSEPECTICFENVPDCVLYTCGHICLCYDCGQNILKKQRPQCPICRKNITDIIKIYKS